MDNQNPTSPIENIPPQNPTVEASPPTPKSFLSTKIILLIVMFFILIVGSGTYLLLNSKPKPAPIVSKEAPTPTPTPIDETANWKTYTNFNHGFAFKYPSDLKVSSESENPNNGFQVELSSENYGQPRMTVLLYAGSYAQESQSDLNAILATKRLKEFIYSNIKIKKIDGQTLYSFVEDYNGSSGKLPPVGGPLNQLKTEGMIKNTFYDISYPYDTQSPKNDQEVFDQILSTFKFTETSPTPTCRPRPACLDAIPRCLIPETSDMCPPTITPSP